MAYKSNILLGRIIKINGYEGAVTVKLEKIFSENIPELESVFLEIEGRQVPFFIVELAYSGADILKLKFDGYNSTEEVTEFIGCNIYLTKDFTETDQTEDIKSIVGYQVVINDNELLGLIIEVIPNQSQWLLNIESTNNKNILIPFHEHFIISVNKRKKIIVMDLPEGLTELN